MKIQITLILVVALCALASAVYKPYKPPSSYRPIGRPDRCDFDGRRSRQRCFSDGDCSRNGVCCDRRGIRGYCKYPRRQSGRCPIIRPGTAGICIHECSGDFECQRGEICCSNGCGHVCTLPRGSGRRSYVG